jgi:hypothetical protein
LLMWSVSNNGNMHKKSSFGWRRKFERLIGRWLCQWAQTGRSQQQ